MLWNIITIIAFNGNISIKMQLIAVLKAEFIAS